MHAYVFKLFWINQKSSYLPLEIEGSYGAMLL